MIEKVSVIIPVFNAANFIENSVLSVLVHSCVGEVILVEDGSIDGSYEICMIIAGRFDKVKVLTHERRQNRGAAISRNLGIIHSKYQYVSFLDADDRYYTNRFALSICTLDLNPDVDACFGNMEFVYSHRNNKKIMGAITWDRSKSLLTYLLNGGYFHTNTVTVRRDFFLRTGYFNQECWPSEDSELWIRFAAKGTLFKIDTNEPLACYFIHDSNISRKFKSNSRFRMYRVVWANSKFLSLTLFQRLLVLKQLFKSLINV